MLNALTIDVEDYFQVSAFEKTISRDQWDSFPSRVVANTQRLLDLFARHGVHGTFFVLGWVGKRFPHLVRQIADAGHEIGCHSYWHRLIYQQTPDQFREDLCLARDVLQEACGAAVNAYRAPTFSITRQSMWALDVLAEAGFRYDSSIVPVRHDRYGVPGAERFPHRLTDQPGEFWECPPSVARVGKFNLPVAGGGYFRLYPLAWTTHCYRQINKLGQPVIFYLHPWEVDPEQPRMKVKPWVGWRHYVNLATTANKLDRLLSQFRFAPLRDVVPVQPAEVR